MPSSHSPPAEAPSTPPALHDICLQVSAADGVQLWLSCARDDVPDTDLEATGGTATGAGAATTTPARLYLEWSTTGDRVWIGDWFALPVTNRDAVSPFRWWRAEAIRVDACTQREQAALFKGVQIPYTITGSETTLGE